MTRSIPRLGGVLVMQWLSLLGLGYLALGGTIDWSLFLQQCLIFLVGASITLPLLYAIHRKVSRRPFWPVAMGMCTVFMIMPLGWYFLPRAGVGKVGLAWLCLLLIMGGPGLTATGHEPEIGEHT